MQLDDREEKRPLVESTTKVWYLDGETDGETDGQRRTDRRDGQADRRRTDWGISSPSYLILSYR